jgi:hypothetical protein
MEVWIYFLSQKFCRSAEIGTYSIVLVDRCHPQYIVVYLTAFRQKFDPQGRAKSLLDKLFHPAKIQ